MKTKLNRLYTQNKKNMLQLFAIHTHISLCACVEHALSVRIELIVGSCVQAMSER
jgi:hypothetical protein